MRIGVSGESCVLTGDGLDGSCLATRRFLFDWSGSKTSSPLSFFEILFEIDAFHLFFIALSVLPGNRREIIDHFGPIS